MIADVKTQCYKPFWLVFRCNLLFLPRNVLHNIVLECEIVPDERVQSKQTKHTRTIKGFWFSYLFTILASIRFYGRIGICRIKNWVLDNLGNSSAKYTLLIVSTFKWHFTKIYFKMSVWAIFCAIIVVYYCLFVWLKHLCHHYLYLSTNTLFMVFICWLLECVCK